MVLRHQLWRHFGRVRCRCPVPSCIALRSLHFFLENDNEVLEASESHMSHDVSEMMEINDHAPLVQLYFGRVFKRDPWMYGECGKDVFARACGMGSFTGRARFTTGLFLVGERSTDWLSCSRPRPANRLITQLPLADPECFCFDRSLVVDVSQICASPSGVVPRV